MIDLSGRVALVTGASRGIGAATALALARAGADVLVHWHTARAAAEDVARGVERLGRRAGLVRADLASAGCGAALEDAARSGFGRLDILVNNAGIWTHGPFESAAAEVWRETLRINLEAVFEVTQALLPLLRRSEHAAIVNVASTAAQRGEPEHAHYAASKGALVAWTKSLAVELAPGIRVNAVAPGWVDTDMVRLALHDERKRRQIEAGIPLHRAATAEEIAGPIAFLVSDLALHITGEILNVNGGAVLCG